MYIDRKHPSSNNASSREGERNLETAQSVKVVKPRILHSQNRKFSLDAVQVNHRGLLHIALYLSLHVPYKFECILCKGVLVKEAKHR